MLEPSLDLKPVFMRAVLISSSLSLYPPQPSIQSGSYWKAESTEGCIMHHMDIKLARIYSENVCFFIYIFILLVLSEVASILVCAEKIISLEYLLKFTFQSISPVAKSSLGGEGWVNYTMLKLPNSKLATGWND